ncbi:MAG: hypothetical protein H7122_11735 [Chitinophagaceae bacterium]|nr:hypothetical protein [Chitinophagaceae bacterium]
MSTALQIKTPAICVLNKLFLSVVFFVFIFCLSAQGQNKERNEIKIGVLCRQDNSMLGKLPSGEPLTFNNEDSTNTEILTKEGMAVSDKSANAKRIMSDRKKAKKS